MEHSISKWSIGLQMEYWIANGALDCKCSWGHWSSKYAIYFQMGEMGISAKMELHISNETIYKKLNIVIVRRK